MFSKSRTEKQLLYSEIERLKKINGKLEDENRQLHGKLDDIEKYREKYKELVDSVKMMKKKYEKQLNDFDRINDLYSEEIGKLKK